MTPTYRLLRRLLRHAAEIHYLEIESAGESHVPAQGPVVFAANHPNSIMDTVILGTRIDRQLHYLAKSDLFDNWLLAQLFRRCGVIPLHRAPANSDHNRSSFEAAYELLEAGRCLGIFPEGRNSLERGLLRIKTGTARIALGAEARSNYELGVDIVPVGLNFEDRDRFFSKVVVRFGEPIEASQYADLHRSDATEAVRQLTTTIEERLRELVTRLDDGRIRELTDMLAGIGHPPRMTDDNEEGEASLLPPSESPDESASTIPLSPEASDLVRSPNDDPVSDLDEQLQLKQTISDVLEDALERAPTELESLRRRTRKYHDHLEQLRIREAFIEELAGDGSLEVDRRSLAESLHALLLAPVAAWGLLHNFVPWAVAGYVAEQQPDEPKRAITGLLTALVLFPLSYLSESYLLWHVLSPHWLVLVVFVASLPVTGLIAIRYLRRVAKYRRRNLLRTVFRTRSDLLESLLDERTQILDHFRALAEECRPEEASRSMAPLASSNPSDPEGQRET